MSEDHTTDAEVWEFMAMVKAALYAAREFDEETAEDYAESTWECYQVIERRIREYSTTVAFGVPEENKEESVKTMAEEKFKGGFGDGEMAEMEAYYNAVPAGDAGKGGKRYWNRDDFDPYSLK